VPGGGDGQVVEKSMYRVEGPCVQGRQFLPPGRRFPGKGSHAREGHGPSWPQGGIRDSVEGHAPSWPLLLGRHITQTVRPQDGRDGARPSTGKPMAGHGPSWPQGGIRDSVEGHAPSWPLLLGRHITQTVRPQDGRDGARPSTGKPMEGHGPSWPQGGIRDSVEGHAPSWPLLLGRHITQTVRPQDGRDGARPSTGKPMAGHGPSWPQGGIRDSVEGHAPSWPLLLGTPYHTNREATDATERVPPRENPWRATVPRGRDRGTLGYGRDGARPSITDY
jgi:hypothetical protein